MKYYVFYVLITLGVVLASQHTRAASFDCGKAATPAEKAICADKELSKLDSELNDVYSTTLGLTKDSSKLRVEQRDWLKRRDDCVRQTLKCEPLPDIYRARILRVQSAMDQEQCSTSHSAIFCAQWEGDKADQELEKLLHEMKSRLVSPDEELLPEKAWEQYRDEESMSRMSAVTGPGGWEIYGECNANLTKTRVIELRSHHFCDVGGCPAQKP
jgi:uncharacterized protein